MVDLATKEISECLISRIEEDLPVPNYSYKTIDYVIDTLGYPEVYFCLGSDSIDSFRSWKDYEKILERVRLLVAQRKADFTLPVYLKSKAVLVEHELMTISSTDLRGKFQMGEPLDEYLHATTIDYISKHNLYR
jgi:nicotinate-nucleotide adenylyltransferase